MGNVYEKWISREGGRLYLCIVLSISLVLPLFAIKTICYADTLDKNKKKQLRPLLITHMNLLISIKLGLGNGRVEAINNKIKVTLKMGYGFRNMDNLFLLLMLKCSDIQPKLPFVTTKDFTNSNSRDVA